MEVLGAGGPAGEDRARDERLQPGSVVLQHAGSR